MKEKTTEQTLNKKYGFKLNTAWVICSVCQNKYPSTMEMDYSADCADCEELSFKERAKIKLKKEEIFLNNILK
jgi:hypothetical protein|tara:strand:- start:5572 stop:5790 length:219 start_codon:yes stop_codon:yes gene_type:complete